MRTHTSIVGAGAHLETWMTCASLAHLGRPGPSCNPKLLADGKTSQPQFFGLSVVNSLGK